MKPSSRTAGALLFAVASAACSESAPAETDTSTGQATAASSTGSSGTTTGSSGATTTGGGPDGGGGSVGATTVGSGGGSGGDGGGGSGGGGGGGTGLGPGTLHTLTLTLATDKADRAAMDALPLELCLSDAECFPLRRTFRRTSSQAEQGAVDMDVHAFEGLAIPHEAVDRFELRAAGSTTVTPVCMSVRFDGEPVACTRTFDGPIGASAWLTPEDAASCFGCWDRGPDVDLRITHGPLVGALRADAGRASIWARTDATLPVELVVSTSADMADAWVADTFTASADDDFTVQLEASGLEASRRYHYQLRVDGVVHAPAGDALHPGGVFSFTMPPPAGVPTTVRFALGSCARAFRHGIFESIRAAQPELLLAVGDYHYGNVLNDLGYDLPDANPEADDPFLAGVALDDFRWFYRTAHAERADLLADVPILDTWDDHDYGGNEQTAHGDNPGRRHARRALSEYFANPPRTANPDDEAIYFRKRHGNVELFVLDARTHRPRLQGENIDTPDDPSADPLGAAQSDWLVAALAASTAPFKLVAAGTMWSGNSNKAWAPFRVARDALLERIVEAGVDGVVLVSGGPHSTRYATFDVAGRTWHEIVASPLSSGSGSCANTSGPCTAVKNFVMVEADDTVANPRIRFQVFGAGGNLLQPSGTPYLADLAASDLD